MTSREAAQFAFGLEAVHHYELVKSFYTHYGTALESVFAERVDGRRGAPGQADVITPLGEFEFCSQANTKNSAGDAAQRASGRTVVQVAGRPRPGRISAADFLHRHGIKNPDRVAGECEVLAAYRAKERTYTPRTHRKEQTMNSTDDPNPPPDPGQPPPAPSPDEPAPDDDEEQE